jgi:hypothetical protein
VSRLPLTVVVASVNGLPYLRRCLESLLVEDPAPAVVVADWTDAGTRADVRRNWPSVRLLSFDEPIAVPELRAAGIADAQTPYVAVLEDHCVAPPGWASAVVAAHARGHDVVGGPIRNGATSRLRDWAAFLCEYSEHMEPVGEGPTRSLVGMNVSYSRAAIDAMQDLLSEGRWETWLHPRLLQAGFSFQSDPRLAVEHVKDFGFREFVSQRYHYARSHAGMRNALLGRRRVVYLLGSPAIVPLMYGRIVRNVIAKRRHRARLIACTPLLLAYLSVWAAGEAVGYGAGGGRSILKVK